MSLKTYGGGYREKLSTQTIGELLNCVENSLIKLLRF